MQEVSISQIGGPIMRFAEFAYSRSDRPEGDTAVFTFGRMNPPTRGHKKLTDTVVALANRLKCDHFVFLSNSFDNKKNPLAPDIKLYFVQQLIPGVNFVLDPEVKNPWAVLSVLKDKYTKVYMVAGSDRVSDYQRLDKYAKEVNMTIEIVSAGERDPDSDDSISGMSGTKARLAAAKNDIGLFRAATGWDGEISVELMHAVRAGMGL